MSVDVGSQLLRHIDQENTPRGLQDNKVAGLLSMQSSENTSPISMCVCKREREQASQSESQRDGGWAQETEGELPSYLCHQYLVIW